MLKAKLLVVGPCQSGKTVLCNYLAEQNENSGGDYRPTQGVRILEFEANNIKIKGRNVTVDVELWDCSGDHKFESCWAALAQDTNGIVFVFNPDQQSQDKDIEAWHRPFIGLTRLRDNQCLVMALTSAAVDKDSLREHLAPVFAKIPLIKSNIEEDPDGVRSEFNKFLTNVVNTMSEKSEQEELNIMNNR